MRKRLLGIKALLCISSFVVLIDQLSKYWAHNKLHYSFSTIIIPKLIKFKVVKNTGAAFSLLNNATPLLAILSLLVSLILIVWISKNAPITLTRGIAVSFLLGGSIGNGIDRWIFGYVIDFIEIIPFTFPIFNVADIAINISIFFFLLEALIKRDLKTTTEKASRLKSL